MYLPDGRRSSEARAAVPAARDLQARGLVEEEERQGSVQHREGLGVVVRVHRAVGPRPPATSDSRVPGGVDCQLPIADGTLRATLLSKCDQRVGSSTNMGSAT